MTTVIAHRGASAHAPENTLAAARRAVVAGADAIECDVHRTRDGELVVIHDRDLRRTTDAQRVFPGRGPCRVADFTLAELKRLDAGSWFGALFAGEPIPTLREWAAEIGPAADLLIEMKRPRDYYPGIELDLAAELRTAPALAAAVAQRRVVVQSFDHTWVRRFRELVPDVAVGLLCERSPGADAIERARRYAHHVNPAVGAVDRLTVSRLRDAGLGVSVWTANSHRQMRRALSCHVDGVITDHPDWLKLLVTR
jgi:glycerophosphoryl diester phosphodiesterase